MKQEVSSPSIPPLRRFESQEEIERFIRGNKLGVKNSYIDSWLKQVDNFIKDVKLKIYFRKRMYDLMEEIKANDSSSPYTRMCREQKMKKEQEHYVPIHIISIPMGGKNKKY